MPRPTLIRNPVVDPSKSAVENLLELTELYEFGPVSRLQLQSGYSLLQFAPQDIFTNTRSACNPDAADLI